jgi:thioesterase domain-containing protein
MANAALLRETEQFLYEQIPLTRAMGVRVEAYDEKHLVLAAPLEPNHNHLGTAFGGSLSAIATLTGYALLWLELGHRTAHIVVRESSINYRYPVTGTIRAVANRPEAGAMAEFNAQFQRTGRAKMSVPVSIGQGTQTCVSFTGIYVALAASS